MTAMNWQDITFTSHDGLRLYARRYGRPDSVRRPVLCLAGLTRNCRDFHDIATALSNHPLYPREVYCLDYRGRGKSDCDPNWRNYTPWIEMIDTLDFMSICGLSKATVLGASRGGIIAMLMAVTRPTAIGAVVLNDIGPVIETAGLARIMGYAGKIPLPPSWEAADGAGRAPSAGGLSPISAIRPGANWPTSGSTKRTDVPRRATTPT